MASYHVFASSELEIFPYHHNGAQGGGVFHGTAVLYYLVPGGYWPFMRRLQESSHVKRIILPISSYTIWADKSASDPNRF